MDVHVIARSSDPATAHAEAGPIHPEEPSLSVAAESAPVDSRPRLRPNSSAPYSSVDPKIMTAARATTTADTATIAMASTVPAIASRPDVSAQRS